MPTHRTAPQRDAPTAAPACPAPSMRQLLDSCAAAEAVSRPPCAEPGAQRENAAEQAALDRETPGQDAA